MNWIWRKWGIHIMLGLILKLLMSRLAIVTAPLDLTCIFTHLNLHVLMDVFIYQRDRLCSGQSVSESTLFRSEDTTQHVQLIVDDYGGFVVRNLYHVHQVHDGCIFVAMRLFGEKAAWVHQAYDAEQRNLFYMMIGLIHHEKQTPCI